MLFTGGDHGRDHHHPGPGPDRPGRRGDLLCSCTRKPELLQPDESDPGSLLGACACGVWTVFEDESRPGSPPWTDVRAYELDIEPDAASTAA